MSNSGYMKAYHCILDTANRRLKSAEFALFYCIYRKTLGWNKYVDRISLSQFVDDTGLSKQTVFTHLASLEESKWIHVMRKTTDGGLPYNEYSLGEVVYKLDQSKNHTSLNIRPVVVYKLDQSTPKSGLNIRHTKDSLKDTIKISSSDTPVVAITRRVDINIMEEAEDIFSKLKIKKRSLLTQYPAQYICDVRQRHADKLQDGSIANPGAYFVALLQDAEQFELWQGINQ